MFNSKHVFLKLAAVSALLAFGMGVHAENGVDADRILLGSTMDKSGPNGTNVMELIAGMQLAFDLENSEGGVNGRKIETIFADDAFVKDKAIANLKMLDDEKKVFSLIGGTGSGIIPALMPLLIERKLPMVGSVAGGVSGMRTDLNRYFFNTRASYDDEALAIVSYFASFGFTEFSMVYSDDGFGKAVRDSFAKAAKTLKITMKYQQPVGADFNGKPAITALAALGNIPVVFGGSPKHAAGFIPDFKKLHKNQIYSISTIGNIYKTLGPSAENMIISQAVNPVFDSSVPVVVEFQNAVKKTKNLTLLSSMPAMEGFIQAKIVITALKKSGKNPTRESFVDALESFNQENIGGYFVTYEHGKVHIGNQYVELIMIGKDGKMIF